MFAWSRLIKSITNYNVQLNLRSLESALSKQTNARSNSRIVNIIKRTSVKQFKPNATYLSLVGYSIAALNISMSSSDSIKGVPMATLKEADKLFDDSKFEELLELLKKQLDWENNEQVLWRAARCEFQLAKKFEKEKNKYAELVNQAYEHVKKSLDLDDKNGLAHKWAAILLDATSTLKGTKGTRPASIERP